MNSRTLTLKQLTDAHACRTQCDLFQDTFGDQVEVTVELAISVADKFDWTWAANNLLSYHALAEYKKAETPALAEYEKATAPAWAEYNKAKAPAWAKAYIMDK